jgi:hypothetical protein
MTDLPRHPDVSDGGGSPDRRSRANRPWWAYALVIVVVGVLVLMVALHLAGGFGPGSH